MFEVSFALASRLNSFFFLISALLRLVTEKAMASHSSTFAWKIPWTEELGGLQSMGSLESDMTEWLPFHFSLSCIGEGNGNPLQCSCLENPRYGGAWWAAIYVVAQIWTRLKPLSSSSSKDGPVVCVSFIYGEICAEFLFVCLFAFPLMGKAEWGGIPVCWWLGLYVCFVCCLDEVSCTRCYWWLGDAGSYIQVVSFVWILTIWYSPGLVL